MTTDASAFHINKELLQDEVANALRHMITTGDLDPGERLVESDLAEKFGVSRAPLREALRQLTVEGLLVNVPRKGTFVVQLSEQDIREIYSLRLALETVAVEMLVDNITEGQLEELNSIIEDLAQATLKGNLTNVVDLDMQLHESLCRLSGHSRVYKAWVHVGDQLRSFFTAADSLYEDQQIIERHEALVAAISSGNKERAVATLRDHIFNAAERVLERMPASIDQQATEGGT